jgi:hypothetical protein
VFENVRERIMNVMFEAKCVRCFTDGNYVLSCKHKPAVQLSFKNILFLNHISTKCNRNSISNSLLHVYAIKVSYVERLLASFGAL